eukprot:scaffold6513_cov125-Isochrysis_galbana.AAC.9
MACATIKVAHRGLVCVPSSAFPAGFRHRRRSGRHRPPFSRPPRRPRPRPRPSSPPLRQSPLTTIGLPLSDKHATPAANLPSHHRRLPHRLRSTFTGSSAPPSIEHSAPIATARATAVTRTPPPSVRPLGP